MLHVGVLCITHTTAHGYPGWHPAESPASDRVIKTAVWDRDKACSEAAGASRRMF